MDSQGDFWAGHQKSPCAVEKSMSQTPVTVIRTQEQVALLSYLGPPRPLSYPLIVQILIIATAYCVVGRLSLLLAIPPGYASAIWPPAGIALTGVLLCGFRVWPGIVLGSFLVHIWTSCNTASVVALLGAVTLTASISLGAALQALLGASLVRRFVGFPSALDRDHDIAMFLVLGGPVSCLVSATWGVTSLLLAGAIPWTQYVFNWWTWWVGDTIGALTVTQLILVWTAEPRQVWRRRQLSVALPLAVTFAVVIIFFVYVRTWEEDRFKLAFEQRVGALAQTILASFDAYLDVLHSIKSFYASSRGVARHEFHTFAKHLFARHPGIQALSWDRRVSDAQRYSYEEGVQREGYANFQITELNEQGQIVRAAPRPEYIIVSYIEPYQGNESALGYDAASDAERLLALHRARDTGEPSATGRIRLVQETDEQFGLLIFLPIYSTEPPPITVEERRQNLQGYATGVFRIGNMVEASLPRAARQDIALWLYDETAPAGTRLLYRHPGLSQGSLSRAVDESDRASVTRLQWGITFAMAGRQWALRFSPTLDYVAAQRTWQAWLVLACGLLLAGLLGAFLLLLTGRTASIERANTALEREIAEHRRTEEAFLEREARTRAILDTAVDGIITIDEQGKIESLNPAAERLFGYAAAEAVGQNIRIFMPAPYREEHTGYLMRYLRTGEKKIIGIGREVIGQRKNGTTFPMQLAVSEVRLQGRRLFTGIVHDITERQRAQEELAYANDELRRSNQELEHFAYIASHDLKAPLRGITQLATWIEEDLTHVLEPDTRQKMALLYGRVRRLEAFLDDLLQYSRVGRGAEVVKRVNTHVLVTDIVTLLSPPEAFSIIVADTLPTFDTAEEPLWQVFMNLIGNAIKHHDRPTGQVEVAVQDQGEWYEFRVTDDGPGIPSAFHTKIFQMFQTLRPRDEVEGSGMGLAIAKKVVEAQGGMIRVESDAVQRGTTLRFTWRKQWQGRQT
jgi:PAS domain S-box-containing protein